MNPLACITTNCLEITVRDHSFRMDASLFARFNSYILSSFVESGNLNHISKAYLQIIVTRNFNFVIFLTLSCINVSTLKLFNGASLI